MEKNVSDQTVSVIENIRKILSLSSNKLSTECQKSIDVSNKLGSYGWTVDSEKTPNNPKEWLSLIETNGESAIADLFSENEIEYLLCMIENRYCELPERWYVCKAADNYRSGHYTEAALFLISVLDYRLSSISPEKYKKKVKQCQDGLLELEENFFEKSSSKPVHRLFSTSLYFPSFSAFSERLFIDGEKYNFEKGIEPPYLNRNWLFHGRMTRSVRRYECIQLLQAFSTLKEIEDYIKRC